MLSIVALSAGTSVGLGNRRRLALSFGLNRMIARWIENGTRDPIMVLAASGLLILVAALACLIPARGSRHRPYGRAALRVTSRRYRRIPGALRIG